MTHSPQQDPRFNVPSVVLGTGVPLGLDCPVNIITEGSGNLSRG